MHFSYTKKYILSVGQIIKCLNRFVWKRSSHLFSQSEIEKEELLCDSQINL